MTTDGLAIYYRVMSSISNLVVDDWMCIVLRRVSKSSGNGYLGETGLTIYSLPETLRLDGRGPQHPSTCLDEKESE